MQLYAGLDLHSRNTYIGIMDKEFKRVFGKRVSNNLPLILKTLDPFQNQLKGNSLLEKKSLKNFKNY
jgi:hypothetical protein